MTPTTLDPTSATFPLLEEPLLDTSVDLEAPTAVNTFSKQTEDSYIPVAPLKMGSGFIVPVYVSFVLILLFGGPAGFAFWKYSAFSDQTTDEAARVLIFGIISISVASSVLLFLCIYACVAPCIVKKVEKLEDDVASGDCYKRAVGDKQWKAFVENEFSPNGRRRKDLGGLGTWLCTVVITTAGGLLFMKLRGWISGVSGELSWLLCLEMMGPIMFALVTLTFLLRLFLIKRLYSKFKVEKQEAVFGRQAMYFGGVFVHENVTCTDIVDAEPLNLNEGRLAGEDRVLLMSYTAGRDKKKTARVPIRREDVTKVRAYCQKNWSFYKLKPSPSATNARAKAIV